tara:strand:- start:28 stop:672 length:645 start_codon:yes stop_codon:yes gene_type:complete
MKKFLFNYVIPYLLYVVVYLWCATLRKKNLNTEAEGKINNLTGPYILTLWHGRIFYLFYYLRNRPDYFLLISPSSDGDLLAKLARLMGYSVIRGSSFKRAVPAARSLIRVLREGHKIIIIADGSRGPRCVAQTGSIQLAGITKLPLFPMTFGAKHKVVLSTWDRFILPLPFTCCSINFGPPIYVPSRSSEELVEEKRAELENSLQKLDSKTDKV